MLRFFVAVELKTSFKGMARHAPTNKYEIAKLNVRARRAVPRQDDNFTFPPTVILQEASANLQNPKPRSCD